MATIKRNASAQWSGSGKEGKGAITTQSGVLSDTPYSFARRFGEEKGTNPEELIAAAHAGCFTMALAFQLSGAGHAPDKLDTKADVSQEHYVLQRARDTKLLPIRLHEGSHRDADHAVDTLLRGRGREVEQHRLERAGEARLEELARHDVAILGRDLEPAGIDLRLEIGRQL